MDALILPALLPVVAEGRYYFSAEPLLRGLVKLPVEGRGLVLSPVLLGHLLDEWHDPCFEFLEHNFEPRLSCSRLVALEEGVVGMVLVAQDFRGLTFEWYDLLQVRCEERPVAPLAGLHPGRLRQSRHPRDLRDQIHRQTYRPLVVAPGASDERTFL
jgi:hypothetical protein